MPKLFMITTPIEGFAEVNMSEDGACDQISVLFRSKQVVFKMREPDYVEDFMKIVDQEWVEYTLSNSDHFMVHHYLMNEYSLSLN